MTTSTGPVAEGAEDGPENPPFPLPDSTLMVFVTPLAVTTSSLPLRSKSPTATARGTVLKSVEPDVWLPKLRVVQLSAPAGRGASSAAAQSGTARRRQAVRGLQARVIGTSPLRKGAASAPA